jgi:hypothetical protein
VLSPVGGPLELVEIELPAGARVAFPPIIYAPVDQQIWVLDGHLRLREGDTVHELETGDGILRVVVRPTRRPARSWRRPTPSVGSAVSA